MEYINNKALADADTSLKFAMLFSSRSFDALAMNDTKVRSTMLKILETNYMNAEIYRTQDKNRLYNSITMLGEYYHRVRLADNSPVTILGESLLKLLQTELSDTEAADVRLAKLVLSQITLNGRLLHTLHQPQLMQLFYHIRRQLIEQPNLTATVKALLLMTLDMYYSNFQEISKWLEDMYTEYFLQGEHEAEVLTQNEALLIEQTNSLKINGNHKDAEFTQTNVKTTFETQTSEISPPITKKWSEQVCDEVYDVWNENTLSHDVQNECAGLQLDEKSETNYKSNTKTRHKQKYQPKQTEDQLPRWRATRFNRDNSKDTNTEKSRRFSASFEHEQQNGHGDGHSIRLYNMTDRLKHSQEKSERIMATSGIATRNYYNAASIANSNWDRHSQHDDRSERSYVSNYERGQQKGGRQRNNGSRQFNNNNNKQTYDKPPRFQKHQQKSAYVDSWRKSSTPPSSVVDYKENYETDGRRPTTHAFTLPRQTKTVPNRDEHYHSRTFSYRRRSSQSPTSSNFELSKANNYRGRPKNQHNMNFNRYDSQSSLASETSSVYQNRRHTRQFQSAERQFHPRNNKPRRNSQQKNQLNEETQCDNNNHDDGGVDEEIVKNARQTADYMNFLSQK